jgi:hypothetical protein
MKEKNMKINNAPETNILSFRTIVNKTKIIVAFSILCAMFSFTVLGQDPTEEMIDLGARPLSEGDMNQVMTWIAVRTSALRLPFCWKQSFTRGAGEPLSGSCAAGLEQNGALCYPQCKTNYSGAGPVCWGKCPSGFNDIGAFCQKPSSYGRGTGYALWNEGKCNSENSQGCEKWGAMWYPKCAKGFHNVASSVCSPDCPAGYNDTGTGCAKPSYGRGAGEPFACRAGTEKNGLLCYPQCGKADFNGVGPVCWQKCPGQQSTDCGAACATNQGQCALATGNMVAAPIIAAVSIATLGSSAMATAPAKAVQIGASVSRMTKMVTTIKSLFTAAKGSVTTLVGGAQNLKNATTFVKGGVKVFVVSNAVRREVDMFSKEFADNFAEMTSKEIDDEINKRFEKDAAYQIKRQWGIRHLSLMLEADGFAMAKDGLAAVSVLDPTGLVSVANAFMHPICKSDAPFPNVTAINNPVVQPQAQNGGTLNVGAILRTNEYVVSPSKKAYAIMQDDGNLVVYRGSGPSDNQGYVWGSVQVGGYAPSKGSYYAVMQDDGNLVVYRGSGPSDKGDFVWGSVQSLDRKK